jgi:hypothetical protein
MEVFPSPTHTDFLRPGEVAGVNFVFSSWQGCDERPRGTTAADAPAAGSTMLRSAAYIAGIT